MQKKLIICASLAAAGLSATPAVNANQRGIIGVRNEGDPIKLIQAIQAGFEEFRAQQ